MGDHTKEFKILIQALEGRHAKRMNAALDTADDETFMLNYIKLLEYVKPKLQRTTLEAGDPEDRIVRVIHTYEAKDEKDDKGTEN